jgi:hypothetical protein
MASKSGYWRIAFALAGAAMMAGGAMHPPGQEELTFLEHTAVMLASPMWPPSHALSLLGALLLLAGLLFGRRDPGFERAVGPKLILIAIIGAVIWCLEGAAHLFAYRDLAALGEGGPTPILDLHLALAVVAYPLGNFPLALVATRLARSWGRVARGIAWLGAAGALAFGVAGPLVVLSRDLRYTNLFPIGAIAVSVWLLTAGLVRPRTLAS